MSMIAQPYTYVLVHKQTGYFYYGVRFANKVLPKDDLGKIYFTSSKTIEVIIKAEGVDAFDWHIRKIFHSQ